VLRAVLALVATQLPELDPEAAAVLFGAADALGGEFAHSRHHVAVRAQAIQNLQVSLGEARYVELYNHGSTMNASEATHYAHAAIRRSLRVDTSE